MTIRLPLTHERGEDNLNIKVERPAGISTTILSAGQEHQVVVDDLTTIKIVQRPPAPPAEPETPAEA